MFINITSQLKFLIHIKQLQLTLLAQSEAEKGHPLFEGDIIQDYEDRNTEKHSSMKALPSKGGLWLERSIPYEFHESKLINKLK